MAPPIVSGAADLADLVARLVAVDRYALDTEFHRERTYWPRLALLQVAWPATAAEPAGVALIDPLAIDPAPLAEVLAGPGLMVAHAAEQDLEVLERACGRGPARLMDTQVAAGFAGHGTASLSVLSRAFLGLDVLKGDRLTDWRRRPLTDTQITYAASDVANLLDLADAITARLDAAGRRSWAEEESEVLRVRERTAADPERAWWKLRDARQLRGSARGVAQEVAAWRELRAQHVDQPIRTVLPDLAVQAIAHRPPASAEALGHMRGLDGRRFGADVAAEILAAVERGRHLPPERLQLPPAEDVPKDLRPAVALLMAWAAQLGRDEGIDASLLATRGDVAAYLRGDQSSRLSRGWRSAMVARPLQALVEGRAALAFDRGGRLVIEDRSARAWVNPGPAASPPDDRPGADADPAGPGPGPGPGPESGAEPES